MDDDYAEINSPPYEYRVTIENSQDWWEYTVTAHTEGQASDLAQALAREDGWNGFGGPSRIVRLDL
jgi:hypothetical protein